jgi:Chromo (CHRromatin Organisation MOdifier) domain
VYEVEKLRKVKGNGKNRQYLVQWKQGDKPYKDSWVRATEITPDLIEKFHEKYTTAGKLRKDYKVRKDYKKLEIESEKTQ